ncbi:DUF6114 domain-containing protein [Streptomyces telluris]|uniref:DUF6114 domain-containing protein n=1 Tax=Streptomyces telluris TaxID=2720021 RepID=A0A9X2RKQ9_9ACTN|nr:DUF6114 domain-containing protein [Streptomyces telluris]MCQ8770082.1 DUF6114 domain-containing protein [Streptomyces telluris]
MAAGTGTGTAAARPRPRRHPWAAWRRWRKARPFWGGLATVLAGAEISAIPLAPLKIMLHQGIAGIPSVLMGLVMVLMGLSAWFAPQYRTLAGVVTVMIAAAALVMSNLGGFLIGTILGVVGGGMVFAWQPVTPSPAPEAGGGPGAAVGTPSATGTSGGADTPGAADGPGTAGTSGTACPPDVADEARTSGEPGAAGPHDGAHPGPHHDPPAHLPHKETR